MNCGINSIAGSSGMNNVTDNTTVSTTTEALKHGHNEQQTNLTLTNEVQMSIAQRRHHTRRLKRNRKNYWHWDKKTPGELGVLVDTPHPCSCRGCGNQRKREGETRQEQIARIRDREVMG